MAEPAYPEAWIRAWALVLRTWPGAGPMPRVDAVHVKTSPEGLKLHGKYDPRRHAVVIYAHEDRWEALATLVHELAHAWAPPERLHHGAKWRATFVQMFEHLTGGVLNTEWIYETLRRVVLENPDELDDVKRGAVRGSDKFKQEALDLAIVSQLDKLRPRITVSDDAIFALAGQCTHRVVEKS